MKCNVRYPDGGKEREDIAGGIFGDRWDTGSYASKEMGMSVEVSVVIPCCSGGELLGEAVESVLGQTLKNVEILLVDNNASDDTRRVAESFAKKYPDRITVLQEHTQGVCSARNTGIRAAKGRYIALLDDDDLMFPDRLEKQLQCAENHPEAAMILCGQNNIDRTTGRLLEENVLGAQGTWQELESLVRKAFMVKLRDRNAEFFRFSIPSTMFFAKDTALKAGLFDPRMNPYIAEDDVFCMRMFFEGPFELVPEPLVSYRVRTGFENKFKSSENLLFSFVQFDKMFRLMWESLGTDDPKSREIFREISAYELGQALRRIVRFAGNPKDKRMVQRLSIRLWKMRPLSMKYLKMMVKTFFPHRFLPRLFWFDGFWEGSLDPSLSPFIDEMFRIPK